MTTPPSPIAGFLTAPLSQEGRAGGRIQLHCEAVGIPVPEIQWWFEGNQPGDPSSQLWDGARQDRVHIHATYGQHAASAMSIEGLRAEDAGTYECRASNDPDRNHLTRAPRVRWIHAQASVVVLEREWPGHLPQFPSHAAQPWLLLGRTQMSRPSLLSSPADHPEEESAPQAGAQPGWEPGPTSP